MKQIQSTLHKIPFELVFWIMALAMVGFIDPYAPHHHSLCPLERLGMEWCPGCGLGRSMNLICKGEFAASFQMHPLGGFAILVIIYRIFEIIRHLKNRINYGQRT